MGHENGDKPGKRYRGSDVPESAIRRYAREVAQRFKPEKIILFGSHAYGEPQGDSDVDILVIMPARNEFDRAVEIRSAVIAPFPMDLIVRTPYAMKWRLREGDWFLREIVSKGKVLYEAANGGMGPKGRNRRSVRKKAGGQRGAAARGGLLPRSASDRKISKGRPARRRRSGAANT